MTFKADLKVQLWAGTVLVAESSDSDLWSRNFGAMRDASNSGAGEARNDSSSAVRAAVPPLGGTLDKFASSLGISIDVLQGACEPVADAPYLTLDAHRWAAFKRNTPKRGTAGIPPITLALTLLSLWFRHSRPNRPPTIQEGQAVLGSIQLRDHNPQRAVRSCRWLRNVSNVVTLVPDEIESAIDIARAYCTRQIPGSPQLESKFHLGPQVQDQPESSAKVGNTDATASVPNGRANKSNRPGAKATLKELREGGFFSKPRACGTLRTHIKNSLGYSFDAKDISKALLRLVQDKLLTRSLNSAGEYEYRAA